MTFILEFRRFRTDCESCTWPISIKFNPVSMEAGEYGPTYGARFFAICLEVIAVVAGLLWVSWCVFRGAGFFRVFFSAFFFFERTRPAASVRPLCLIYLSARIIFILVLVVSSWSIYRAGVTEKS